MHIWFLSPHLDDVAFSCAGTLLRAQKLGHSTQIVTVFTQSVAAPQGFALRCQTDKGLPPELDYMALRRDEDREFARIIGAQNCDYWPFREAPHRGYNSPRELFAGEIEGDNIWQPIAEKLREMSENQAPDLVFAPQGLGNHVDHLQLIRAVQSLDLSLKTAWYRDTPYAIREPDARPCKYLQDDLSEASVDIAAQLETKIAGACAYESQIGFQFGGADEVARKLRVFHKREAEFCGFDGYAERFLMAREMSKNDALKAFFRVCE